MMVALGEMAGICTVVGAACPAVERQCCKATRIASAVWKRCAGSNCMALMMICSVGLTNFPLMRIVCRRGFFARMLPGLGVWIGSGSWLVSRWYMVAPSE